MYHLCPKSFFLELELSGREQFIINPQTGLNYKPMINMMRSYSNLMWFYRFYYNSHAMR